MRFAAPYPYTFGRPRAHYVHEAGASRTLCGRAIGDYWRRSRDHPPLPLCGTCARIERTTRRNHVGVEA